MGTIFFVENKITGVNEYYQLIAEVVARAKSGDKIYIELAHYVAQGLDALKDINIPVNQSNYEYTWHTTDMWDASRPLSFTIVKQMASYSTVYEFRINWSERYFRTFFFIHNDGGEQYKIFVRAMIKEERNPPEVQQAIAETALHAIDFYKNPAKNLRKLLET